MSRRDDLRKRELQRVADRASTPTSSARVGRRPASSAATSATPRDASSRERGDQRRAARRPLVQQAVGEQRRDDRFVSSPETGGGSASTRSRQSSSVSSVTRCGPSRRGRAPSTRARVRERRRVGELLIGHVPRHAAEEERELRGEVASRVLHGRRRDAAGPRALRQRSASSAYRRVGRRPNAVRFVDDDEVGRSRQARVPRLSASCVTVEIREPAALRGVAPHPAQRRRSDDEHGAAAVARRRRARCTSCRRPTGSASIAPPRAAMIVTRRERRRDVWCARKVISPSAFRHDGVAHEVARRDDVSHDVRRARHERRHRSLDPRDERRDDVADRARTRRARRRATRVSLGGAPFALGSARRCEHVARALPVAGTGSSDSVQPR